MRLRNGPDRWGAVSLALHWSMAAGILATIPFGLRLARMEPSLSTLWLYGLHKTVGVTLLALAVLRLLWHRLSPPPAPLSAGIAPWQMRLARATHRLLYVLMVAVPLAGWAGSSATGIPSVVFGRWTLPAIAPPSEAWDRWGFRLHLWLALAMAGLVALHVAGAAWRHRVHRDDTLRRMLGLPLNPPTAGAAPARPPSAGPAGPRP